MFIRDSVPSNRFDQYNFVETKETKFCSRPLRKSFCFISTFMHTTVQMQNLKKKRWNKRIIEGILRQKPAPVY